MENQSLLSKIISEIQNKINQFAVNKMTNNLNFDDEVALFEMQSYGYDNLGEYARSKFF